MFSLGLMRAYRFGLLLALGAILIALVPTALSETPRLRYDGTYYRTAADGITHHLRFYSDGTVISAATPSADTPSKIARWFHRDWPLLPSGRYSVHHESIQITLNSNLPKSLPEPYQRAVPRTQQYSGVIGRGYLTLRRSGREGEKRYIFVKVPSPKRPNQAMQRIAGPSDT